MMQKMGEMEDAALKDAEAKIAKKLQKRQKDAFNAMLGKSFDLSLLADANQGRGGPGGPGGPGGRRGNQGGNAPGSDQPGSPNAAPAPAPTTGTAPAAAPATKSASPAPRVRTRSR